MMTLEKSSENFRLGWLVVAAAIFFPSIAIANDDFDRSSLRIQDTIILKSGDRLYGEFISEAKEKGRIVVVFKLDDGASVKLDRSKTVSKIVRMTDADRAYNQRLLEMADTADDHWSAREWCLDQKSGRTRYKDQIRFHLERIMELDPNDNRAKQLLGYEFVESEGRWVPTKEYWALLGYEKKGTRWAPMMQRVASGQAEERREVLGLRKGAFRRWKNDLRKGRMSQAELARGLFQICDAAAIGIIYEDAKDDRNPQLNELYAEAFGRIPTSGAIKGLVYFYIEDNSDRALTLLGQEHYSPEQASAMLSLFLRDTNNIRVRRAAFAIGELNPKNMILPLVDALVTTHQLSAGTQAGRIQLQQNNQGVGGLNVGGNEEPVKRDVRNVEVVDALRKITGQDFGYNHDAWIEWYVDSHTNDGISLRGPRRR